MTIAYLVEPTSVTTSGTLQGKSLRTYEVQVELTTHTTFTGYSRNEWKFKPTGVLYSVKNGKIIKSKTKASLSSKYVSVWATEEIRATIDKQFPTWNSTLYSTPELALAAKSRAIQSRLSLQRERIQKQLDTIDATIAKQEDISFIVEQYPEFFV